MGRGEIRWYRFAKPDKKAPVLILTWDSAIDFLGQLTVAPVTSTVREIPTEVSLSRADGLQRDCAVNLDHLQTVSKASLGTAITRLNERQMECVQGALLFALGFAPFQDHPRREQLSH